jgi:adsorption protein B
MGYTEWLLAILYLIGGLNDLFTDLIFHWGPLRRWLAQGRESPAARPKDLEGIPEQPIAILIPAWDESAVIGAMLESTCSRLDYKNYDIFVGTYPNDEETQMEVARAAFDHPRIHKVVCPNDGPTSKADCLNWIVEAIKLKEQETGRRYAIFTLNDAEDVVHPLVLKVFNRFVPEYDMVQLPVLPFERHLHKLTGGTYLDEFAEVHLKNLDARLALGGMVPSAGVGTAFGREACDELAAQTNHVLFPPVSLTEDYDFSFRLYRNGRKSGLAKVWTLNTDNPKNPYRELVGIREFFPAKFGEAVRQKQRWMLGITFQGWEKLGWGTGWREKYMLLRDRIGVLTSLMNAVTLFIVWRYTEAVLWALAHHMAWDTDLGPFQFSHTLTGLIEINMALVAYRIVQRALCVKQIARRRQILMVPLRLLWCNVIDFYCTVHAIRRYTHSRVTGKPLKWMKTAHEFPNVEQLLRTHRRLGDLLLEDRLISPAQLSDALTAQRWKGHKRRPLLGELLVGTGSISEEQLDEALTRQARSKVRVQVAAAAELADLPIAPRSDESELDILVAAKQEEFSKLGELGGRPEPLWIPEWIREHARHPEILKTINFSEPNGFEKPSPSAVVRFEGPAAVAQNPPIEFVPEAAVAAADAPAAFAVAPRYRPELVVTGPARVIPISKPERRAHNKQDFRRFTVLHQVVAKWKTPFPSKRILVAIGTRPEAIKLAPLVRELQGRMGLAGGPERVFVCATGQHQDMVEEALATFGVSVDLNLNLMTPGQTLAGVSSRVLEAFAAVIDDFKPDWVIVQGDTATTAMAGLAAFYAGVRVAHVEAGLRTKDLQQPFPEEFNRRMVGMFAHIHFAATGWAKNNLLREGVDENDIIVTGNTGIDALRSNCERLGLQLDRKRPKQAGPVKVLVTAHRRENLDGGIAEICEAILSLVAKHPGRFVFLWPLHPNPRVGDIVQRMLEDQADVLLTPAAKYDELLGYLDMADVVMTDSGGLQEEAPSFGRPVLILRDKTERPEGVRAGMAWLVGTDRGRIEAALEQLAQQIGERRTLRTNFNPYGDGFASKRIADFFAGMPVQEFGEAAETDEMPRRMPVRAHAAQRLQTVS